MNLMTPQAQLNNFQQIIGSIWHRIYLTGRPGRLQHGEQLDEHALLRLRVLLGTVVR